MLIGEGRSLPRTGYGGDGYQRLFRHSPERRLSVLKIKQILQLKFDWGVSEREISRNCFATLDL